MGLNFGSKTSINYISYLQLWIHNIFFKSNDYCLLIIQFFCNGVNLMEDFEKMIFCDEYKQFLSLMLLIYINGIF